MKTLTRVGCLLVVLTLAGFAGVLLVLNDASAASARETGAGGVLSPDTPVPGWLRPLLKKDTGLCPQVTVPLLAAQLYSESAFHPTARSGAGAEGIAQFTPGTWATWGQDGDGDGRKDVFDPADAVAAQARYDCALAKEVRDVAGDNTDNMLAAYNAGSRAVIAFGGVPPYSETRTYVSAIRALAEKWSSTSAPRPLPPGQGAARAIAAAKTALNSWYRWGGHCVSPFQGANGCDCSSLVKMAWAAGGVNLPRVTQDQVHVGTAVWSVSQLRPGDLLFSEPGADGPGHVGMYAGNEQVIESPHTGAQVHLTSLSWWIGQIVAMRHIA